MPRLSFISDRQLEEAVSQLLSTANNIKNNAEKNFHKNVIDPFSLLFRMSGFGIDERAWKISETARQTEKSLQNHVGAFHQGVLGLVPGWKDLGVGQIVDLECADRKIIAEVKNKYSTVSGGKLSGLYNDLCDQVMPKHSRYKDFTAYYVEIIPKRAKRVNVEFTPSDKAIGGKCAPNPLIRQIDGASFYALVTGQENALRDLYRALPDVIESVAAQINGYKFADKKRLMTYFEAAYGVEAT